MQINLVIYKKGVTPKDAFPYQFPIVFFSASDYDADIRAITCKWTFRDVFMGEQCLTFDVVSDKVIEWEVGDYCVFRGKTYTLNYVPSCKQQARIEESGNAFVYESVKMDSFADELTRCIVLDVVPTTGDYGPYAGMNYTGSAVFSLYCGETKWTDGQQVTHVYAPVHALADKLQTNLNRLYPNSGWHVYVKDENCHSEDVVLQFNNWTAAQALAEVHNTFKCDYAIIGRSIYIGYSMPELTSSQDGPDGTPAPSSVYYYGYGKGYPRVSDDGTALFEIKRTTDSNQSIITRLRAYGSTKNMPYRYYMLHYNLPETMYVHNLQLPDTFLPYGNAQTPNTKAYNNEQRGSTYRKVFGEANDAYIDKNDDAGSCPEGIREGVGAWDGSNSDLEEIYPTIEGMTYKGLRDANVPDKSGATGANAYQTPSVYHDDEPINEVLGVAEDCNIGDGVISLESWEGRKVTVNVKTPSVQESVSQWESEVWAYGQPNPPKLTPPAYGSTTEIQIAEITDVQYPGDYILSNTHQNVVFNWKFHTSTLSSSEITTIGYALRVVEHDIDDDTETTIMNMQHYYGARQSATAARVVPNTDILIRNLPIADLLEEGWTAFQEGGMPGFWRYVGEGAEMYRETIKYDTDTLHISRASTIKIYFKPIIFVYSSEMTNGNFIFQYRIKSNNAEVEPNMIWSPSSGEDFIEDEPFHIYLKDLGFDLSQFVTLQTEDSAPQISIKSGGCVGRSFDIKGVEDYTDTATGKKGWCVELQRYCDDTLHVYYPNEKNILQEGDLFVILGIELPGAYIKEAEVRLLRAATDYLADNSETRYVYEPALNDIYLRQNYDKCEAEGHEEQSIFWKLYAGLKFPFRGIPVDNDPDSPLPILNITISQVEIRMGEKETPQVTIQLNDDIEQSTIKKLVASVDRLYNANNSYVGSGTSAGTTSAMYQLIDTEGKKKFLSKKYDDTAEGKITFKGKTTHNNGLEAGSYVAGVSGAKIGENGDAEVGNIVARGNAVINGTSHQKGDVVFGTALDKTIAGAGVYSGESGMTIETDYLNVHKKMFVKEVQVQETTYIGGCVVNSPANGFMITGIEEDAAGWELYFDEQDSEKKIAETWRMGDQALSQNWNIQSLSGSDISHRWWRLVTGVGVNQNSSSGYYGRKYIYVSKTDCEQYSDDPTVGDKVVMLGHQAQYGETDAEERQGAIIEASAGGGDVPYIRIYRNISTFDLADATLITEMSYKQFYVLAERMKILTSESVGLKLYYIDDNDNLREAQLGLTFDESGQETKAVISADNINLNGVVTANEFFKINLNGSMEATSGSFSGHVKSVPAIIHSHNIDKYVHAEINPYTGTAWYVLDLEMMGRNVIFYESPANNANPYWGDKRKYPTGYGSLNDALLSISTIPADYDMALQLPWVYQLYDWSNHGDVDWLQESVKQMGNGVETTGYLHLFRYWYWQKKRDEYGNDNALGRAERNIVSTRFYYQEPPSGTSAHDDWENWLDGLGITYGASGQETDEWHDEWEDGSQGTDNIIFARKYLYERYKKALDYMDAEISVYYLVDGVNGNLGVHIYGKGATNGTLDLSPAPYDDIMSGSGYLTTLKEIQYPSATLDSYNQPVCVDLLWDMSCKIKQEMYNRYTLGLEDWPE